MSANDPLQRAIGDWQRKHRIADDDPVIAVLELVRLYLQHARRAEHAEDAPVPSFDDFRGTMGLLDRRSKSFINQASDLVAELRRFGQNGERLNRVRVATLLIPRSLRNAPRRGPRPLVMSTTLGYSFAAAFWLAALCVLILRFSGRRKQRAIVRLAGFKWTRAVALSVAPK